MGAQNGESKTTTNSDSRRMSSLKCFYANVDNSLLSKMEEVQNIVNEFSYDVLAFNEVKPKNGEISDVQTLNIKGYTLLPSDFSKADTRGVCVYLKNHLTDVAPFFSSYCAQ